MHSVGASVCTEIPVRCGGRQGKEMDVTRSDLQAGGTECQSLGQSHPLHGFAIPGTLPQVFSAHCKEGHRPDSARCLGAVPPGAARDEKQHPGQLV